MCLPSCTISREQVHLEQHNDAQGNSYFVESEDYIKHVMRILFLGVPGFSCFLQHIMFFWFFCEFRLFLLLNSDARSSVEGLLIFVVVENDCG